MNTTIRNAHRWISAIFMLCVLANFAVMPLGDETIGMAVGAFTLLPLFLLMATGSYLFVLPYLGRSGDGEG